MQVPDAAVMHRLQIHVHSPPCPSLTMPAFSPSSRTMWRTIILIIALWGGMYVMCPANVLLQESFDYGGTGGSLAGMNGGSGFATGWSSGSLWQYTPTGLTFSNLPVSGGAATYVSTTSAVPGMTERQLTSSLQTAMYGSYLFQVNARSNTSNTSSLMFGPGAVRDYQAALALLTPRYAEGQAGIYRNGLESTLNGTPLAIGTTYLGLYEFNPLTGATTEWILTASQYDYFMANGLTSSAMNGASIGTGANNIFSRLSISTTTGMPAVTHMSLHMFKISTSDYSVTFDEIRVSSTSFAEVVAAPEPSRGLLLLGGGVLCLMRRRRRGQ